MTDRPFKSCVAIRDSVRSGQSTAVSHVKEALAAIAEGDGPINAFRETFDEEALGAARAIDATIASGDDPGPLAGVPIAIKDNIATTEGTTTCGSRMLEGYRSPFDATVIERLRSAGAIPIGHTNCDEFAMGSSTESCAFGVVGNPWDTSRVPGGSSGGSAAAVAAGFVPAALGSDTGGSIRQPAALCGCIGLKPSYGRVSRYGLVAFGSSLDQVGPLTNSVEDAALLLEVISGFDERDSTTAHGATTALSNIDEGAGSLRVGIPRQYRMEGTNDAAVDACIDRAIEVIRALGAEIVDVDLSLTDAGISTYYVIAPAEASSNLARFDGIRYGHRSTKSDGSIEDLYACSRAEGFGPEVQRRIMLGTYVLSSGYYDAYYTRALKVRRLIKEEFDHAFESCDILLGATSPSTAFPIGSKPDPLSMYLCDVYTVNANMAGICGISIPGGFDEGTNGNSPLPIGIQLQAQAFDEPMLIRAARALEQALEHEYTRPG